MSSMSPMSDLWDLPGQQRAAAVLRGAVQREEVSHAWAFVGPPAVGQERAARSLAAALNCTVTGGASRGCGRCDVCRRCLRGAFPSLWEFEPTGTFHRVADVRGEWLPVASRSAVEGRWKVLRVVDADRMNEAAANAFLKALEEPPQGTVWVLDIADPDELPDTILSRCRVVRFAAWSAEALDARARELGLEESGDRPLAVRAAFGSPVTLSRLSAEGGLADLRAHRGILRRLREEGPGSALLVARGLHEEAKRRTAELQAAGKAELAELTELYSGELPRGVAKQVEDRLGRRQREAKLAALHGALDDLGGWLRDCLLLGAGGDPAGVVHIDAVDDLRTDADALGAEGLLAAVDRVLATRSALESNVSTTLALEAMLLELSTLAMVQATG